MDIHFCDLCGVRVTDVDLRGGHGIRKQYDVICATCLELGHGKEWLARHQRGKAATAASQPAAALAANASNKQAPVITQARDRVRTYEDGDDSPVVAPKVIAADEPEDGIATSELSTAEVAAEAAKGEAPKAEANPFAAAASSFSALAATPKRADAAADVDEDAEKGEGLSDESTSAPIIADAPADEAKDDAGESPFGYEENKKDGAAQKDETLPSDREPLMVDKPADKKGAKQSSSGSASFKKSSAGNKSSSSNSKAGNKAARSGKTPAKKVNKNKNIMIMSALSLAILIMLGLFVVKAMKPAKKEQEVIHYDLSQDVKDAIKDAKMAATLSLKTKNVGEMKAAKDKIQLVRDRIDKFVKEAKHQNKDAWDDEAFGRYLEGVDWPDTALMIRLLNDEIVKQQAH
jgi:hypothetical protein